MNETKARTGAPNGAGSPGEDLAGTAHSSDAPSLSSISLENRQTLVLVGNGMVGWKLCQRLVEIGATKGALRLVVFGEEPRPAYDRVHLTELFEGKTEDELTLAHEDWYASNGIELHLDDPVVLVDRAECLVRSAAGVEVMYDRLVFATGSAPFVPPIPGTDLPGVFVYRTVEDLHAIMEYGRMGVRAAVIGGGLLGLEAAKAVFDLGLDVHIVESQSGLMGRQLDAPAAAILKDKVEQLGVHVYTGVQTTMIVARDRPGERSERVLHFHDGRTLSVELVVISAGIRPRSELARASGLELARGGIQVDDHLTSSDFRIFAVGECATHRGTTYGLALPGYRMVDVLVDNLVGGTATFQGSDVSAKLKLLGVTVAAIGEFNEKEAKDVTVNTFNANGLYRKLLMRDGRIVGAVCVGDWENIDRVRDTIEQPRLVSFWDMRRFRSTGNLWLKSESPPVYEWPVDATVCGCMRVTRGMLTQAQLAGCSTVEELSLRTGAGTMCGSCKPFLVELVTGKRVDSMRPGAPDVTPHSSRASVRPRLDSVPPSDGVGSSREPLARVSARSRRESGVATQKPPAVRELHRRAADGSSLDAVAADDSAMLPPPDSSPPPSLRDFLPVSDRDSASFRASSAGARIFSETGGAQIRESDSDALAAYDLITSGVSLNAPSSSPPPPVSSRRSLPTSSKRDLDPKKSHDSGDPSRDSAPSVDSWPPSSRTDSDRPRSDSLPPLKPISVGSAARITELARRASLAPPAEERGRLPLLVAAVFAIAFSTIITLSAPIGYRDSSRGGFQLETLWTSSVWKQVTGYVLVALALVSLLLSLRKRWRHFKASDVPVWRMIHGILGALTLVLLVFHTGLHLGKNMNRALTIDFLALVLLGGVAGGMTALSHWWSPMAARNQRLVWYWAHLILFWPLPVLLILHIVAAYYY